MIRPAPQTLLAAPLGSEGEYHSLAVPMTIAEALVITVARIDDGSSQDAQQKLVDLLERFDGAQEHGEALERRARGGAEPKP